MGQLRQVSQPMTAALAIRERRLMQLVSEGLHNREIGAHLGLDEFSVKRLLSNVYSKTGMDRLQVALWSVRNPLNTDFQPPR